MNGSSPHAWGTQVGGTDERAALRFIPTRMGNTPSECSPSGSGAVHPHTHGEHRSTASGSRRLCGSSPHAWGTLPVPAAGQRRSRFIPTRMGNTSGGSPPAPRSPVHPHTHGEHPGDRVRQVQPGGSSPHAWGTRPDQYSREGIPRFIPTRMGNTRGSRTLPSTRTVHPHTHGEHIKQNWLLRFGTGSSPHAWGTLR